MTDSLEKNTKDIKVPLNITLSPEDKKFLKMYAMENDTTVSEIISKFINKLRAESGGK